MYINIGKLVRVLSMAVALLVLALGVVTFIFSQNATEQSSGTLAAIFGLLLLWFTIWLQRTAPPTGHKKHQEIPQIDGNNWHRS